MGFNDTPSGNRIHIGFFGRRNAGKSSLVNAVTGQELAVVSDTKGTTTDPVYKAMELLPLGPVMIIDTPGIDDEGELGELRIKKTKQVLNKTDIAVLVVDGTESELIRDIMETEMNHKYDNDKRQIGFWQDFGAFAPAWGMVGTLIGLINMMKTMGSDSSAIGDGMSPSVLDLS